MSKSLHLILGLAIALLGIPAVAQGCMAGAESFRVMFGNFVGVTPEGAQRSMEELHGAIGDTLDGQAIVYDVSYNQTNTLAVDLAQAAAQQHIESYRVRMMALDGLGLLPDWAVSAVEHALTTTHSVIASDVQEHVEKHRKAILHGAPILYASPYGVSGFLDRDDFIGYGSEHYYTDCSQLKLEEHIVGLNYYEDRQAATYFIPVRPATAAVTSSVPGSTRTFYHRLARHWGPRVMSLRLGSPASGSPRSLPRWDSSDCSSSPSSRSRHGAQSFVVAP